MRGRPNSAFPRFRQSVLYPEDTARVLAAVRAAPGSVLRSLAATTDLHPNVVRGHAQVLSDQGHVELRRTGSRILVHRPPRGIRPGRRGGRKRQATLQRLSCSFNRVEGKRWTAVRRGGCRQAAVSLRGAHPM